MRARVSDLPMRTIMSAMPRPLAAPARARRVAFITLPIGHSLPRKVVGSADGAKAAGAEVNVLGADLSKHIFTKGYVQNVISFTKERATFVKDFWTIASYLFVSPQDFEKYGIKAGAAVEPDLTMRSSENALISSSIVNISLSSPGFQPRNASRFTKASGK